MTRQEEIVLARMINMRMVIDEFETVTMRELHGVYRRATQKLLKDVKTAAGKPNRIWTNTRKIALLEEAQLMYAALEEQFGGIIADKVADVGVFSYQEMNNITSWDGRVDGFNSISLTKPQLVQLVTTQKLGKQTLYDWVGSALQPNWNTIKAEIQQGLVEGRGFQPVLNRLADNLAIPKGSKQYRDLETTIKTYMQSVNVKAQQDVFRANDDVVKKVEWSAIMENGNVRTGRGTCPRCMALDGLQWPVDSPAIPNIPLHARCRCVLYPITLTWRELGFDVDEMEDVYQPWTIRNLGSKGREILKYGWTNDNYPQFWAKQSKAFQDAAVGPVRAEMIRKAMPFRSIIDDAGNLIPINQLPKRFQLKKKPKPKPKPKKKAPPTGGSTPPPAAGAMVMPTLEVIANTLKRTPEIKELNKKIKRLNTLNERDVKKLEELDKLEENTISETLKITERMTARNVRIAEYDAQRIEKSRVATRNIIKPPPGGQVDWYRATGNRWDDPFNAYSSQADWDYTFNALAEMLHPDIIERLPRVSVRLKAGTRAYYANGRDYIRMGNDYSSTVFHEYGHHMEYHLPDMFRKMDDFRRARTVGETISEIGDTGEYGWADKFFSHYCGRKYDFDSTEILSMGLERMWVDPFDFYETDPEYFELILKVMWGEL